MSICYKIILWFLYKVQYLQFMKKLYSNSLSFSLLLMDILPVVREITCISKVYNFRFKSGICKGLLNFTFMSIIFYVTEVEFKCTVQTSEHVYKPTIGSLGNSRKGITSSSFSFFISKLKSGSCTSHMHYRMPINFKWNVGY